jgi:Thioesterase-like superfamily
MASSLFVQEDATTFTPTEHSRGPWSPDLLHGGPVAALLAHQLVAGAPSDEWFPARLTVDLVRPVSLATLQIACTVIREGRKAQLLSAECRVGDTLIARAGLQLIVGVEVPIPTESPARQWATADAPAPPEATPRMTPVNGVGTTAFHSSSVEHRSRDNALSGLGHASDWIRVGVDLLPGVTPSPFERVVCAADFGNGIRWSRPFDQFTYVNADLSVHLFRLPVDEWVLVDAVTYVDDGGVGLAESALFDRLGRIGRSCQSLVVAAR